MTRSNLDPWLLAALVAAALIAMRQQARGPFWAGFALIVLLFVSPLCALSSALFSVRVAHHIILTAVAAPLFAFGLPRLPPRGGALLWAAAHILAFWVWHAPAPYALALASDGAFWLMQLSLLATAIGFWASLRSSSPPLVIGLLLAMMVQMGLLGALITFAGTPLYAPHLATTMAWGLGPLEDQQLAGLIMWAPAALLYLGAALWTGWHLLGEPPRVAG
ncbi:cytochrome c oxidase assembly protein [Sphingopyxis sp.]|uniref:cytochrome c oxidase assembly protein n=1 Tax=Sphingopyxis sp. TaxID=1908224 RepID=UPI002E0976C0|nr:cytochrome c oxidase assembly protein [Sphingopyxis sp.]